MRWVLVLALLLAASAVRADVVEESGGIHHFPGRGRIGPESCTSADTRQGGNSDGTWAYFFDAIPTCPMGCPGGPGAWCVHERGQWNCCGGAPPEPPPCPAEMICPPPRVQIGIDGACGIVCSPDCCNPNPCQNDGACLLSGNGCVCLCPCGCTGALCETCPVTTTTTTATTTTATTGTGSSTTVTTTTTSTTTTTTSPPPVEHSLTFLWLPEEPSDATTTITNSNLMRCNQEVPALGITNAEQITWAMLNAPGNCGIAIYSADGSTRLFSTGGIACSSVGNHVTGSAFTLDPGTAYQVCVCSDGVSNDVWISAGSADNTNGIEAVENTLAVPGSSIAAHPCVGGSPPVTTGILSPSAHVGPPIILLGTTAP